MSRFPEFDALVAYNRWANRRVFSTCLGLDSELLRAEAPGSSGSIERTLKHSVGAEDAFLALLRGRDPRAELGPGTTYYRQDLAWFASRADEIADALDALLATARPSFFEGEVHVPWFDRAFTRRDALLQAITHAIQHRAQVFSILGARGIAVPNLDYIAMRIEADGTTPPA